jgi:hypothetical protein
VAFSHLFNRGELIASGDFELDAAERFLGSIPKFQEATKANKIAVVKALRGLNLPITLENIRQNFGRIPGLGEDSGYSEGYRSFFGAHPDYAVDGNKPIIDAAHS